MQFNPKEVVMQSFIAEASPFIQKSEAGKLTPQDFKELDQFVKNFNSKIPFMKTSERELETSASISLDSLEKVVLDKVADIKEKNLDIQRGKLILAAKKGTLRFEDFQGNVLPFKDKMEILLKEAPTNQQGHIEIRIIEVPNKRGERVGELMMVIKPAVLIKDGQVQSQIVDPLYREELMRHKDQEHFSFEFFDTGRQPEIARKLQALKVEKSAIDAVGELLTTYFNEMDEEAFNRDFTPAQRAIFNIPAEKIFGEADIGTFYDDKYQDALKMFPVKEDGIKMELEKGTIIGRFAKDGSIGELKSVSSHSDQIGGKELMDFWDRFCTYMEPSQVYLEDDAKIEGKNGSYNLKLFRLMGLPDRTSWYTDSYKYQSYQKGTENLETYDSKPQLIQSITPFKEMTLNRAVELLGQEGMNPTNEATILLRSFISKEEFGGTKNLGDLVKHLGDGVRRGENLHKDIDNVFKVLSDFSTYNGTNKELLDLREKALHVLGSRFYRKSYS